MTQLFIALYLLSIVGTGIVLASVTAKETTVLFWFLSWFIMTSLGVMWGISQ